MSEWLNYHHLFYLWTVAQEGSVARACVKLRLAQPTISAQLKTLEAELGEQLFDRSGRTLKLTEMGHAVYRYADDIFSLGQELMDFVKNRPTGKPQTLRVGFSDVLPKLVAYKLLEPAVQMGAALRMRIQVADTETLLGRLALHQLDLVLTDAPISPQTRVRAFNHPLGQSSIAFFAAPELLRRVHTSFPKCLDGMPFILPAGNSTTRRGVEAWFAQQGVQPLIRAEVDDSALIKVLAQAGMGAFFAPAVVEKEIERQYNVRRFGASDSVQETFYAITVDKKIKSPAVAALCTHARQGLFG